MASDNNGMTLGKLIGRVILVDVILSALIATANSLGLYVGGEAIGASVPATIGAAVTGWILQFVFFSVIQGFFLTIFGGVGVYVVSALYKTADEKQQAALNTGFRWGGRIVFLLSALLALYNGFAQYALFSAGHADPTLNLVAAILSSILVLVYSFMFLGWFALIATIVLSVFSVALSGGFKRKKDIYGPNAEPQPGAKTDTKPDAEDPK